jgi:hypothetical protein
MPDWMRALSEAGMLCLPLAHVVCQDDSGAQIARHGQQSIIVWPNRVSRKTSLQLR